MWHAGPEQTQVAGVADGVRRPGQLPLPQDHEHDQKEEVTDDKKEEEEEDGVDEEAGDFFVLLLF